MPRCNDVFILPASLRLRRRCAVHMTLAWGAGHGLRPRRPVPWVTLSQDRCAHSKMKQEHSFKACFHCPYPLIGASCKPPLPQEMAIVCALSPEPLWRSHTAGLKAGPCVVEGGKCQVEDCENRRRALDSEMPCQKEGLWPQPTSGYCLSDSHWGL